MATTTTPMTIEEFAALPDDGNRYELVRGVLVRMSPTGFLHLEVVAVLLHALRTFVVERSLGVVGGEAGFVFSRDPLVIYAPDIVFVRADRLPPKEQRVGFLEIAPDLIAEVLSPSDTASAMDEKILVYLKAGVRLVWVVDPHQHSVTVYRPDRTARVLIEGEAIDGEDVLPGFRVPVAELFP